MGSQPAAHRAVTLQHMHICISQAEIPLIRLLKLPFTKLSRRAASKPRPPAAGQADRQPAWALWPNGPMALWSASSPSSPPPPCGCLAESNVVLSRGVRAPRDGLALGPARGVLLSAQGLSLQRPPVSPIRLRPLCSLGSLRLQARALLRDDHFRHHRRIRWNLREEGLRCGGDTPRLAPRRRVPSLSTVHSGARCRRGASEL